MLSEVIDRLHIGDLTINDVRDAEFSDPELVKVEKESKAVDYENGTTPADDWKLTSLKPFDTDETLTLTLNDKSLVVINLTDAQTTAGADDAYFKVTIYNNNTQYHSTLKSAVDFANTSDANKQNRAATILLLKDYTLSSADNNTVLAIARHPVIIDGNGNKITFSASQNNGITLQSGRTPEIGGSNQTYSNNGSFRLQNITIIRDTYEGAVIDASNAAITSYFNNCVIDGSSNRNASKPLIDLAPSSNVTIDNTTVKNHAVSADGVCAVNAIDASHIYIKGETSISGNTAKQKNANLNVNGVSRLVVGDSLTNASIGVTSPQNNFGTQFATLGNRSYTGWNSAFTADNDDTLYAGKADGNGELGLYWVKRVPSTIGPGSERTIPYDNEYGRTTTPSTADYPQVKIPLEKTITSNVDKPTVSNSITDEEFSFNISCTPSDGASITPNEAIHIAAHDIINNGVQSGNSYTYSLIGDESPWTVTFSEEGTYTVTVTEEEDSFIGISTDSTIYTATYYVVEEEGVLRVAEAYKEKDATVVPEKTGTKLDELDTATVFYTDGKGKNETAYNPGITTDPTDKQKITMDIGADKAGAITTKFKFDFSRSFRIEGKLRAPDSDGIGFAFSGNETKRAYRHYSNNGLDDLDFSELRNPSIPSPVAAHMSVGYKPADSDFSKAFLLNLMTKDGLHTQGVMAFRVIDGMRFPYIASEGLTGDTQYTGIDWNGLFYTKYATSSQPSDTHTNYWLYDNATENQYGRNVKWSDFYVEFICSDPATGKGTLKFFIFGREIEFNDFVASEILGDDVWQNACFHLGASVQDGDSCSLQLLKEYYYEQIKDTVTTSFWSDRDGNGSFETQVNTTNSPAIPGEVILVRHTLERKDSNTNLFFENALIRQLKDVDNNTAISGRDAHSYPEGNMAGSVRCEKSENSYNNDTLKNGMRVAIFPNSTNTVFEYKINAPNAYNHTVTEQAMFGQEPFPTVYTDSYGFRTQKELEWDTPSFTNTATINTITYDPAGGTFEGGSTANMIVPTFNGSTFTVSEEPTKDDGWTLTGWKVQGSETVYNVGDEFIVSEDVILVAQWVQSKTLTITNQNTGDYSNPDDSFHVKLTLKAPAGAVPIAEDDARLPVIDGSWTVNSSGEATTTFTVDDNTDANRNHVFEKIPSGWLYMVTQEDEEELGYTVTGLVKNYTAITEDTTVELEHNRAYVVPSGIAHGPKVVVLFSSLLLLAAVSWLFFAIHRRRSVTRG